MVNKAKFSFSAHDGTIQLEGSEDFVSEHIETLTELIKQLPTSKNSKEAPVPPDSMATYENDSQKGVLNDQEPDKHITIEKESISNYPHVYDEINGKLKVTSQIEGKNTKNKMLNTALVYCLGRKLMGSELVPSKDIREVCADHGILDSKNFATIFSHKSLFVVDGTKGGNKDVKLTLGGETKARSIITHEEVNN